jgi:hypothetical protein
MTADGKRKHLCRDPGLKASYAKPLEEACDESVWDHLAGTVHTAFEAGEHGQAAARGIDDRGDELLVVNALKEVER